MKSKEKKSRPIRGSLKPIENTNFDKNTKEIINSNGVLNIVLAQSCREELKEIVALYLQHAARLYGKTIEITQNSKNIFIKTLTKNSNISVSNFADCCIRYFNNEKKITVSLNLSIPECGSLEISKAFQQACKNSEKIIKQKINKILEKMKNGNWQNVPNNLLNEYEGIEPAIKSVCLFIKTIVDDKHKLPTEITSDLYNKASLLDSKITEYYQLVPEVNIYKIKKNLKVSYSSLNQECATLIFCKDKRKILSE